MDSPPLREHVRIQQRVMEGLVRMAWKYVYILCVCACVCVCLCACVSSVASVRMLVCVVWRSRARAAADGVATADDEICTR